MPGGVGLDFSPAPDLSEADDGPLLIERLLPPPPDVNLLEAWFTAVSMGEAKALSTQAEPGSLSPHAEMVATFMRRHFGVASIGGYRPVSSPHDDPTNGHSNGKALDLMVPATPEGIAKGDAIANFLQAHAVELQVKYVIWNQQIWSQSQADDRWRLMSDRGTDTQNHKDHVHVSFE